MCRIKKRYICDFRYLCRCRNRDFASIIPHQPARYRERHNEVFLDFEAFLLSTMRERSTLWIHSQIKACMDATDCQPVSVLTDKCKNSNHQHN
jgi:hypothetical protein